MSRILIAGVGNIFHGDDAFGVEVVRALSTRLLPDQVAVEDFGIRSYDLAYALTDNYDVVILVDAMPRGRPPGTVSLIEPELALPFGVHPSGCLEAGSPSTEGCPAPSQPEHEAVDPHAMNLVAVLRMAQSLGGVNAKLYLVGCEPAVLDCDDGELELSQQVQTSVPIAVAMIESLVDRLLAEQPVLRSRTAEGGQNLTAGCPSSVATLRRVDVPG
jgi:hydrogenase maturation protease